VLVDLAQARRELPGVLGDRLRMRGDYKTAHWTAGTAGLDAGATIDVVDGLLAITPAEMTLTIERYEAEVARIRELLATVDAKLTEASPVPLGRTQ